MTSARCLTSLFSRSIGLAERLAQRGGDHALLGFGHVAQRVAHPVHAAALTTGAKDAADRDLETVVRVGDDQLDVLEATAMQAAQKPQSQINLALQPPQAIQQPPWIHQGSVGQMLIRHQLRQSQ